MAGQKIALTNPLTMPIVRCTKSTAGHCGRDSLVLPQVDMLPSDGHEGAGQARPGCLGATTLQQVGSLEEVLKRWQSRVPGAKVVPISALEGINTKEVSSNYGR